MIENDLDGTIKRIIEKNNQLTRQDVKIEELEEENERLNNIINELEKYIEGQKDKYLKNEEYWTAEVHNYILDKLQELKDSDKE